MQRDLRTSLQLADPQKKGFSVFQCFAGYPKGIFSVQLGILSTSRLRSKRSKELWPLELSLRDALLHAQTDLHANALHLELFGGNPGNAPGPYCGWRKSCTT